MFPRHLPSSVDIIYRTMTPMHEAVLDWLPSMAYSPPPAQARATPNMSVPHHTASQGLNLLYYTLERAKSMLPKGQTQLVVVADCSGFGPSKTPPLPMLKTAFVTMQRHYPMQLGYVMIANAGGPIVFVWKVRACFWSTLSFRWCCPPGLLMS